MVHETPSGENGTSRGTYEAEGIGGGTIDDGAVAFALSALVREDHNTAAIAEPTPASESEPAPVPELKTSPVAEEPGPPVAGEPTPPVSEHAVSDRAVIDQLARTAAELSNLVEHHRRELVDAMAELTRLQRELRSETRAAIAALRVVGEVGSVGQGDVVAGQQGGVESAPMPAERVGTGDGRSPWANGSG